jgi:hypothetical protein
LIVGILGDGRKMLVADDLADANDRNIDGAHGVSLDLYDFMMGVVAEREGRASGWRCLSTMSCEQTSLRVADTGQVALFG